MCITSGTDGLMNIGGTYIAIEKKMPRLIQAIYSSTKKKAYPQFSRTTLIHAPWSLLLDVNLPDLSPLVLLHLGYANNQHAVLHLGRNPIPVNFVLLLVLTGRQLHRPLKLADSPLRGTHSLQESLVPGPVNDTGDAQVAGLRVPVDADVLLLGARYRDVEDVFGVRLEEIQGRPEGIRRVGGGAGGLVSPVAEGLGEGVVVEKIEKGRGVEGEGALVSRPTGVGRGLLGLGLRSYLGRVLGVLGVGALLRASGRIPAGPWVLAPVWAAAPGTPTPAMARSPCGEGEAGMMVVRTIGARMVDSAWRAPSVHGMEEVMEGILGGERVSALGARNVGVESHVGELLRCMFGSGEFEPAGECRRCLFLE